MTRTTTRLAATALLLLPAATPGQPPTPAPPAANVAATVNGEVIRLDEVDAVLKRRPPVDGPLTAAQIKRLRVEAVNDLIDDRLVRQFLRAHGPAVEPADIDRHLAALAESRRKAGKTLADYLRETGQTEGQVRDSIRALAQFGKLVDLQATDAELRKYHAANREVFDGAAVRVAHVVARVGPTAPAGERAAARDKLAKLKADIAAGKLTFAEAARKHSVCPSAPAGGDLGEISRRDSPADEPFARAAFALKVGEVSDPVDTDFGVHLILVTGRKAGTPTPFEKCADQVRDCYAEDVRQSLVAKLRKDGTVQVTVP